MWSCLVPPLVGAAVALTLTRFIPWWGFWVIFPWIGLSFGVGMLLERVLDKGRRHLGRRVSLTMILPLLLLFIPVVNNENFQLEGIFLNILAGVFTKSFIHLALAKLFGPLVFGRAFCGWACWTAAVLEWLPMATTAPIGKRARRFRYLAFALSIGLPLVLVFGLSYDVRGDFLNKTELAWMLVGNALYYVVAVALAYMLKDRRAFCKVACPVAVVMKVPARFRLLRIRPSGKTCIACGACNRTCPMDVDVQAAISAGQAVRDTECIHCVQCRYACPVGAIA